MFVFFVWVLHLLRRFMGGRRNQCTLSSSAAACIIFAINNISTFVDIVRAKNVHLFVCLVVRFFSLFFWSSFYLLCSHFFCVCVATLARVERISILNSCNQVLVLLYHYLDSEFFLFLSFQKPFCEKWKVNLKKVIFTLCVCVSVDNCNDDSK